MRILERNRFYEPLLGLERAMKDSEREQRLEPLPAITGPTGGAVDRHCFHRAPMPSLSEIESEQPRWEEEFFVDEELPLDIDKDGHIISH